MQNPGVNLPSRARLQPISLRMIQDSVVAFVPSLQTTPDVILLRAGLEAHEGVWEIIVLEIILRRKIVSLGFAALADFARVLVKLMHVVRDRPEVVEKFAEHVPAAVLAHD